MRLSCTQLTSPESLSRLGSVPGGQAREDPAGPQRILPESLSRIVSLSDGQEKGSGCTTAGTSRWSAEQPLRQLRLSPVYATIRQKAFSRSDEPLTPRSRSGSRQQPPQSACWRQNAATISDLEIRHWVLCGHLTFGNVAAGGRRSRMREHGGEGQEEAESDERPHSEGLVDMT